MPTVCFGVDNQNCCNQSIWNGQNSLKLPASTTKICIFNSPDAATHWQDVSLTYPGSTLKSLMCLAQRTERPGNSRDSWPMVGVSQMWTLIGTLMRKPKPSYNMCYAHDDDYKELKPVEAMLQVHFAFNKTTLDAKADGHGLKSLLIRLRTQSSRDMLRWSDILTKQRLRTVVDVQSDNRPLTEQSKLSYQCYSKHLFCI